MPFIPPPYSAAEAAVDATKAPINSPTFTGTVGGITSTMVGLGNVDNTSDANKPVSTAQQTALDLKSFKLTNAAVVTAAGPTLVTVNTIVPVDTSSNSVGLTLPSAPVDGSRVYVKHIIQGGTNSVTITTGGTDVFNKAGGSTTKTLQLLNQAINLQYAATPGLWYVTAEDQPLLAMDARYMPLFEGVNTVAASGASQTLFPVNQATVNDITLTANCAITLPTGTPGSSCTLLLRQGGTGSYTVTFTPTPKYASGAVPVLSTAVGAIDFLTFIYVTAWNCFPAGVDFR